MAKVSTLKQEGKASYGIKVETEKETFVIPVVDVRDGDEARNQGERILKAANQSRFMRPSFSEMGRSYQVSRKDQY